MTKEDDDYRPYQPIKDPEKDPCDLSFTTALAGPDPDVIRKLSPYSVLKVELSTQKLRERTVETVVALYQDSIVGTIDDVRADNLLQCMNVGRKYRGVVQRIDGGQVLIRIEPIP